MELPSRAFTEEIRKEGVTRNAIISRNQKWFKEIYIDRKEEPEEPKIGKFLEPGKAYSFTYDAKYADRLEFWDVLPHLMICLGHVKSEGGSGHNVIGINFSYIPPKIRMRVLDKIVRVFNTTIDSNRRRMSKRQYNSLSEIPMHYNVAKRILSGSGFEFAIRSYIYGRMVTSPRIITYDDWWKVATFPTRFLRGLTIRQIYYLYKKNLYTDYKVGKKEKKVKLPKTSKKEVKEIMKEKGKKNK